MGYVKVKAKLSNLQRPRQPAELELLVDTGAIYTVVPGGLTRKLSLKPRGKRKFRLADGSTIEREFGYAEIEINGQVGMTNVVFGKENDAAVLGVTTLEELGLQVDPLTGELKPLELLLYLENVE